MHQTFVANFPASNQCELVLACARSYICINNMPGTGTQSSSLMKVFGTSANC